MCYQARASARGWGLVKEIKVHTDSGEFYHSQLHLCDVGKRAEVSVGDKETRVPGGQQMSVTNSVRKNWYVVCSKNKIVVKINTVKSGTIAEVGNFRYILYSFALSFTLNPNYSISHTIWLSDTLINKNSPKK
jgi:hypothetical protein